VPDTVTSWWRRRSNWPAVPVADLVALKSGRAVSVVIPALNEAATVEGVVRPLVTELVPAGLVDEVVVVDGGSHDGTAELAAAAGARVLRLPSHAHGYAVALLRPLLLEPSVSFVKAAFDRPLTVDGVLQHGSGGRVTELLARPLLNAWWPQLAGFVQPLSGELAARRDLLARLPFATGYGLEIAMLVDALETVGLEALAQADIGERHHRHHSDAALGRMAAEVLAAALDRRDETGARRFVQFARADEGFRAEVSDVEVVLLPPVGSLAHEQAS
jgi:glucosyl-3-phosphoglycerate synthase